MTYKRLEDVVSLADQAIDEEITTKQQRPAAVLVVETGGELVVIGGFEDPYNAIPLLALSGQTMTGYLVMSGRARSMAVPDTVEALVNYEEPEPLRCRVVVKLKKRNYTVSVQIGDEPFDDQTDVDAVNSGFVEVLEDMLDKVEALS